MKHGLYSGRIVLILLLVVIVLSCNRTSRHYIIPQKKFVNVLVDIHLADGMAENNMRHDAAFLLDSASLYGSVFQKYGVTRAEFDSTMYYYSEHPDDFQKLYNKVTAKLKRMEDDLKMQMEKVDTKKETPEPKREK